MATITEAASGFPSSNGHIPFECATIAEVLGERGWNTYMTGKWHLTAEDEMNMASRKTQWPVGRGFERFYGFVLHRRHDPPRRGRRQRRAVRRPRRRGTHGLHA
jgi:arylsulfatase A-like enzyme